MHPLRVLIPVLLTAALASGAAGQETTYDVPFVPTPEEVVNVMLQLAAVEKNDTLYDLGCGDGRIVITAAKKYGTRGIGIDIDPNRIQECTENAAREGVTDRVRFMQANLFETNFSDASVLTLYLLSSVNLRLRPVILTTLKPGVRVVSHDFSMGDWTPDRTERIASENNHHTVYFWVVPANFSGIWEWTMPEVSGGKCTLRISQQFQKAAGFLTIGGVFEPLKDITVTGGLVRFSAPVKMADGTMVRAEFSGNVLGDTFECTVRPEKGSPMNFRAVRDPSTMKALDLGASDTR